MRNRLSTSNAGDSSPLPRRWPDVLGANKRWLAVIGASGVSVIALLLIRRRRLRREAKGRLEKCDVKFGANGTRRTSRGDSKSRNGSLPRPPRLVKSGSLSDTYAWNAQGVDIGAVLGVDIGGTLSKLVYFEKKAPSKAESKHRPSEDPMGKKVGSTSSSYVIGYALTYRAQG